MIGRTGLWGSHWTLRILEWNEEDPSLHLSQEPGLNKWNKTVLVRCKFHENYLFSGKELSAYNPRARPFNPIPTWLSLVSPLERGQAAQHSLFSNTLCLGWPHGSVLTWDAGAQLAFPGKETKLLGEKVGSPHALLPVNWMWRLEVWGLPCDPEHRDFWHSELLCQPGVPTLRF